MKVEFLAGLLSKPVTELAATLKVAEKSDLTQEQYGKLLEDHIKESVEDAKLKAREESDKKHTRLVKTALEKTVKEKFPFVKAAMIDDMLTELEEEFSKRKPEDSEARKLEIEALKLKAKTAEDKLTAKEQELAEKEQRGTIAKKLDKHLAKYEFASDKVKELAVAEFMKANKFIVSGEDLFLEKDGKPVVNFEADINAHLAAFGKPVTPGKPSGVPSETPKPGEGESADTSRAGLFKSLRATTDPAERARIQEQINNLAEE